MHPAVQIILTWLGAGMIGILSAVVVFSIGWLAGRSTGTRLETIFAAAAVIGLSMFLAANVFQSRVLGVASVVLFGWIFLPMLLIPTILFYRLLAWCWHLIVR